MIASSKKDPYEVNNDFGFSFVHEDDIIKSSDTFQAANQAIEEAVDEMCQMIFPLLDNLSKDPEKEVIKWPNRAASVENLKKRIMQKANELKSKAK